MTRQSNNADSRDRIARLFLWLDEKFDHLEQRQTTGEEDASPAEHEKEARTMTSLIRVYEKLVEMKERLDEKQQDADAKRKRPGSSEAEFICKELAGRIERLQKQEARRSGDAE